MQKSWFLSAGILTWLAFGPLSASADDGASAVDSAQLEKHSAVAVSERTLHGFKLTDTGGRVWQLDDFKDRSIIVVAFIGVECPLAKLYSQRLAELDATYADRGVAFIGVDANPQDSLSEMAAHAKKHGIEFPLLRDGDQQLLAALGATRTPEAFVLDRRRRVRYHGRIDDQYGIGYTRDQPQTHALRDAIEALLSDREVINAHEEAIGCRIGKVKSPHSDSANVITYSKHIAPIFRDACVHCHRDGEIAPFPLTEYSEISGWAETIAEVVAEQRMPPWHANPAYGKFANDCSLSAADRETIAKWVAAGAPQGDPADLPEPRTYVSGWQLPREPDIVLNVSPKPYAVPATGEVKYQYFRVDPGFREEKWVSAAQIIPGNSSVVHHILVFARPRGTEGGLGGERGFLFGYVPGSIVQPYPPGVAKRIPADSELIFQVHYTPTGSLQTDQSRIGFVFADPATVEREVITTSAVQTRLNIPPGADAYKTSATSESLPESELLGMSPHMHLRGKSFRYTSVSDGDPRQILLDVPRYDFNWQTGYRLAQPLKLSAGAKIICEATFDNSDGNLNNPDSASWVRWGDQTTDEMMIGYFDILVQRNDGDMRSTARSKRAELLGRINADEMFRLLDSDRNERIERREVPQRWKNQFELLDSNNDEVIERVELTVGTPD